MKSLLLDDINEIPKIEFWPDSDTEYEHQINAVTRFTILSTGIISYHRQNPRIIIAGIILAIAIQLWGRKCIKKIVDSSVLNDSINPIEVVDVEEPLSDIADRRNDFAHSVYGDINNNDKLKFKVH